MARKKAKFEKLSVNLYRRGELRFETVYSAAEAARIAAKWTRKGWDATVQPWESLGTKRNVFMSCKPFMGKRGNKVFARCQLTPAFKKRIQRR